MITFMIASIVVGCPDMLALRVISLTIYCEVALECPLPPPVPTFAMMPAVLHTPLVVLHFVANLLGLGCAHGVLGRCALGNRVEIQVAVRRVFVFGVKFGAHLAAGTIDGRTSFRGLKEILSTRARALLLSVIDEALAFFIAIVVAVVRRVDPILFVSFVEALAPRIAVPVPAI
jgi:hypothetical protein